MFYLYLSQIQDTTEYEIAVVKTTTPEKADQMLLQKNFFPDGNTNYWTKSFQMEKDMVAKIREFLKKKTISRLAVYGYYFQDEEFLRGWIAE